MRFTLNSNTYFGRDSMATLPRALSERGFRRIGVVADESVANLPPTQACLGSLRQHGLETVYVYRALTGGEPTYDYLDEAAGTLRAHEADAILGIGGGSALDLAKGVAILTRNPGRGIDYRGLDKVGLAGTPVILIPTTAGTGSEVTETASFIDSVTGVKLGINGRHVGCLFAVLDPAFVATCPPSATVSAGLDALVHAIEAVTCRAAHPLSVMLGAEAVRLMFKGLPAAVRDGADLGAREDTLLGSHYAGLAMRNAGGGPASGISYPLGVHFAVPHGMAGGLLLPHVVSFNVAAGYAAGYAAIWDRLVPGDAGERADARAKSFSDGLFELCQTIGAPSTFSRWKVGRRDAGRLTELTMKERKGNLDLNPVPFGERDVAALLACVLE
jgi:alcohol dehydrogenase class IV